MSGLKLGDVLLQDFWIHVAGVVAISLGVADLWYFHAFSQDSDLLFMVGGFGAMGLKIINGSAAALRTAALDATYTAKRAADAAAALNVPPPPPIVVAPVVVTAPAPVAADSGVQPTA